MLTTLLSAVCALTLGVSPMENRADTTNVYLINGDKVVNFDGSQLVGKTVSDYKIMTSASTINGVASVSRIHFIRTDGKQAKTMTSVTTTTTSSDGEKPAKVTIVGSDADARSNVTYVGGANGVEVYVDGKKTTVEKMGKIKPERIASMVVFTAGSEGAMKWTKARDRNVIVVELKK